MSLIDDNQVEPTNGKGFLIGVDIVYHRLIGRERDTCCGVGVFVLAQYRGGHVGQQLHEILVGLTYQRYAVGKEQHVLHPSVACEHIYQRDGNSRFSCSCCHDQQASAVLAIEMLTDRLDSHLLIVAVGDAVLHTEIRDIVSFPLLYQQLQVAFGVESIQSTRWVAQAIDDVGLKTIRVVDDRSYTVSLFQAVGIQFGLVLTNKRRFTCPLGFHNGKRQSIAAKEYIVAIAFACCREGDFFRSESSF